MVIKMKTIKAIQRHGENISKEVEFHNYGETIFLEINDQVLLNINDNYKHEGEHECITGLEYAYWRIEQDDSWILEALFPMMNVIKVGEMNRPYDRHTSRRLGRAIMLAMEAFADEVLEIERLHKLNRY